MGRLGKKHQGDRPSLATLHHRLPYVAYLLSRRTRSRSWRAKENSGPISEPLAQVCEIPLHLNAEESEREKAADADNDNGK